MVARIWVVAYVSLARPAKNKRVGKPPSKTGVIVEAPRSANDFLAYGENRAQRMRDYLVGRGACEMRRRANAAGSVANAQDDQIRGAVAGQRQYPLGGISIFHQRFGRKVEVGIVWDCLVKVMNCLGYGELKTPLFFFTEFIFIARTFFT